MNETPKNEMVKNATWEEFRASGLLWFVNTILHLCGWAIAIEINEEGKVIGGCPVKVKYRGFDEKSNSEGYEKLTKYLKENIDGLMFNVFPPVEMRIRLPIDLINQRRMLIDIENEVGVIMAVDASKNETLVHMYKEKDKEQIAELVIGLAKKYKV